MSDPKAFLCSRVVRGASKCDAQCGQCAKRAGDLAGSADIQRAFEAQEAGKPQADNVVEMPSAAHGPVVAASLHVTLYDDGNAQVDGPYEDRMQFHGLLWIAAEAEREHHDRQRAASARLMVARSKESRLAKWQRERRERREAARRAAETTQPKGLT